MVINEQSIEIFKEIIHGDLLITLFPEETVRKFRSLKVFYEFMCKEKEFWEPIQSNRPGKIRQHFASIVNNLETAFAQNDEQQKRYYLDSAINAAKSNKFPCVYSTTLIGQFIKERYMVSPTQADAACLYFFEGLSSVSTRDGFDGLIYSFFLKKKDELAVTSETNERSSLEQLRMSFSDELDKLQHDYQDKSIKVDEDYQNMQNELINWKDQLKQSTNEYLTEKQNTLEELEMLYREKLRFQSPAQYWDELSKSYEKQGNKWRSWVLVTSVIFILFLSALLYIQPAAYFSVNKAFDINSVKSTIIFALIASIFVYVISLFVRLSTSAFHLSRDAKERFQLTHVYLSLLNEKGILDNERSIVLQSIFSRADTGLLKGDSSPTLPDTGISQILKGISGK